MKILHASDFHLDAPFRQLDARQAMIRRQELRALPDVLSRVVRQEQVDLVLLPGDLFDGERVYPETIEALTTALSSIDAPVVIAPGNHDCADGHSPYLTAKWPDNVHIFTHPEISSFDFPELGCTVHGYAFTSPHRTDEPLQGFAVPEDGRIHLLCAHGEVGIGGNYAPISPSALGHSGIVYAALGHIHASSGLRRDGNTFWAYCGCPEGRGFDECGIKGAFVITIDDNGVSAKLHPLCRRQHRVEYVDVSEFAFWLPREASEDLVRIILTGENTRAPDLPTLSKQAAAHFFYAEVRDETTLPQDLWARAEEDSLTGLFLREMRQRLEAADSESRPSILLATRFGLAALEGGEDVCP